MLLSNVFRKNAENAPTNDSTGVELDGCQPLNGLAHKRELSLPVYVFASRSASEFVDCGRAYLTYDFLAAVYIENPNAIRSLS